MKKKCNKIKNLAIVTVLLLGFLSPFILFAKTTNAKPVEGVQLYAKDDDEDGYINYDGSDDIRMTFYYKEVTYYRIKSSALLFPYDDSFSYSSPSDVKKIWSNTAVPYYFGKTNTIEIWTGKKNTGYSTVHFTLPKDVNKFPLSFTEKESVEKSIGSTIINKLTFKFPLLKFILNANFFQR
jgi:hypothetical protein